MKTTLLRDHDRCPMPAAPEVSHADPRPIGPVAARLVGIDPDGTLRVALTDGRSLECDVLTGSVGATLAVGAEVLVMPVAGRERAVVVGCIGRYQPATAEPAALHATTTLQATETLTLRCGEASIDLRADGKVMIRGEDVLVRAKRTQRIRAGTVSIN